MNTIGYFDYFKYPLNKEQIVRFLSVVVDDISELEIILEQLIKEQKIQKENAFYSLHNIDQYTTNRIEGELRFRNLQERIYKSVHRISKFPFVKFVGVSGSLSKGYSPQNADIDLFIITKKNRLWICRTLLHIFKKLSFMKGSQHWYCMNYFIDETALFIEEQNYFTAIELATLIPAADEGLFYQLLIEKNHSWIKSFLPNTKFEKSSNISELKNNMWSQIAELFSSDTLNRTLMNITDSKWKKKWKNKNYPKQDYELAFKTRINISKNHFHNYQKKALEHLNSISQNSKNQS